MEGTEQVKWMNENDARMKDGETTVEVGPVKTCAALSQKGAGGQRGGCAPCMDRSASASKMHATFYEVGMG